MTTPGRRFWNEEKCSEDSTGNGSLLDATEHRRMGNSSLWTNQKSRNACAHTLHPRHADVSHLSKGDSVQFTFHGGDEHSSVLCLVNGQYGEEATQFLIPHKHLKQTYG